MSMARVVDRNVRALLQHRQEEQVTRSRQERIADAVTRFTGSMRFVYIHLVVFGTWIVINLEWLPGVPRFDPSFVVLAMVASVEAIFLSTFVLISQNRMSAMAERMGIDQAHDPELSELSRDVRPEKVMETMEAHERDVAAKSST